MLIFKRNKASTSYNTFTRRFTSSLTTFFEDQELTDITLVSNDGREISAHRVILASASPLFGLPLLRTMGKDQRFPLLISFPHLKAFLDLIYFNDVYLEDEADVGAFFEDVNRTFGVAFAREDLSEVRKDAGPSSLTGNVGTSFEAEEDGNLTVAPNAATSTSKRSQAKATTQSKAKSSGRKKMEGKEVKEKAKRVQRVSKKKTPAKLNVKVKELIPILGEVEEQGQVDDEDFLPFSQLAPDGGPKEANEGQKKKDVKCEKKGCNRRFTCQRKARMHYEVYHLDKTLTCPFCPDKKYKRADARDDHLIADHGDQLSAAAKARKAGGEASSVKLKQAGTEPDGKQAQELEDEDLADFVDS